MQTDRELNDLPLLDGNEAQDEPILSKTANKGTEARMRAFVKAYASSGQLLRACKLAGIDYSTHHRRLRADSVYAAAFEEAELEAAQLLEDTALERALAGDTPLLILLLRRFRPSAYRERSAVEISGSLDLAERLKQAEERIRLHRQQDASAVH